MTQPDPPSHITLELEDKDIREDISKIIEAMSKMRAEATKDKGITKKQADEYLHLTYRLASGIRAIADKTLFEKMQAIAGAMERNSALLSYDPRQDGYWQKKEKRFVRTLDELLINISGENFQTLDAKHHLLQAVKFLGAAEMPFEEKARVYETITPFGAAPLPSEGLLRRILGSIVGSRYEVERIDDLTLRSDGDVRDLAFLVREASGLGYERVRMKMPPKDFEKLGQLPELHEIDMQIVGTEPIREKTHNEIVRKIVFHK